MQGKGNESTKQEVKRRKRVGKCRNPAEGGNSPTLAPHRELLQPQMEAKLHLACQSARQRVLEQMASLGPTGVGQGRQEPPVTLLEEGQ